MQWGGLKTEVIILKYKHISKPKEIIHKLTVCLINIPQVETIASAAYVEEMYSRGKKARHIFKASSLF